MPGESNYTQILKNLVDWDSYLMQESGLPGPRANLELVQAAADLARPEQIDRWLSIGPDQAPTNTPGVFLPVCGAVALGRRIAQGEWDLMGELRGYASDGRWRVREGVAMGLQRVGAVDMARLIDEMSQWIQGGWLEKRAAAAALAEPALLKDPADVRGVLDLFDRITITMVSAPDRKEVGYRVLRQAMGYCWSVAVAALPEEGKALMEKWFTHPDPDVTWVMKENLKKNRLQRMDEAWVDHWRAWYASTR